MALTWQYVSNVAISNVNGISQLMSVSATVHASVQALLAGLINEMSAVAMHSLHYDTYLKYYGTCLVLAILYGGNLLSSVVMLRPVGAICDTSKHDAVCGTTFI
jgi:adenine-specific DNA methylase